MRKPKKLQQSDLDHPKDSTYTAWNGDIRQKGDPTRWTGQPSLEDRGSFVRREKAGLKTTTNKEPGGGKPAPRVGAIKPRPDGHKFNVASRRTDPTKGWC